MRRTLYETDHEDFRTAFRQFLTQYVEPRNATWARDGIVSRDLFSAAGDAGFLGYDIPEELGGAGVRDFRFNAVMNEEIHRSSNAGSLLGLTLQTDICVPYFLGGSPEQQKRWLPRIGAGDFVTAVAMTEPGAGSDLASITTTAVKCGDYYVVNGSKTFISCGINADLVVTAVKTDPDQRHRGMSLLVIERGMEGFERGRKLDKIGQETQDTAELFFKDVRVPVDNLIGTEGDGFAQLTKHLPRERMSIAISAVSASRAALEMTLDYAKERKAFGKPVGSFQHSKFVLAEMETEIDIAEHYVDDCVRAYNEGALTAVDASKAKWWCTELQGRVVDQCLQLHGGYGYMREYPISQAYLDARITRIYGGTTEIMKEVVGRSLGL